MVEFEMAMICAERFWHGTCITEGAFAIMQHVRNVSPQQFIDAGLPLEVIPSFYDQGGTGTNKFTIIDT